MGVDPVVMKSVLALVAWLVLGAAGHEGVPWVSDEELGRLERVVANPAGSGADDAAELLRQQRDVLPAYRDLYRRVIEGIPGTSHEFAKEVEGFYSDFTVTHPLVARVDFPRVVVRQAVWDDSAETLLFTLEAREPVTTKFRVVNIPTNYVARLEQEGRQIAAIDEHGQASGPRVVNLGPGEIEITVRLEGVTRFVVRPE